MYTVRPATRLLALPLLLWALQPLAIPMEHYPRPAPNPHIGAVIAEQGNRALLQIRAETRPALELPRLPAQD